MPYTVPIIVLAHIIIQYMLRKRMTLHTSPLYCSLSMPNLEAEAVAAEARQSAKLWRRKETGIVCGMAYAEGNYTLTLSGAFQNGVRV